MWNRHVLRVASALLLLVASLGVALGSAVPRPSVAYAQDADGGLIAYIGPDGNVWLVHADGSEPHSITLDGEGEYYYGQLRWSSDGSELAVTRYSRRGGPPTLLLADPEEGMWTPVLTVPEVVSTLGFDWSPSGNQIVYSSGDSLYTLDLQSLQSSPVLRSQSGERVHVVGWSPDGAEIAFSEALPYPSSSLVPCMQDCFRMGVADLLTGETVMWDSYPEECDWVPDSSALVCIDDGQLQVRSPAGVLVRTIGASPVTMPPLVLLCSPEGSYIAVGQWGGATYGPMTIVDVETGRLLALPDLGDAEFLAWSPSGRLLLIRSSSNIRSVDIYSGAIREIAPIASGPVAAAWQPVVRSPRVDLGFRPDPNGYQFANKRLWRTWEMFEQFFGTQNVTNPDGAGCIAAERFFEGPYRETADGWSCLGFSLTSLLSYLDWSQPYAGHFSAAPFEQLYHQAESSQLTAPIAYYSGVQTGRQWADEYRAWLNTCGTHPDEIIEPIRRGIQSQEPVVVSLNTGTSMGWHTMVPYRVEEVSPEVTDIYVYDSEAPGQERAIRVETSGTGWQWQYTFVGSLGTVGARTGGCSDMYPYPLRTSLQRGIPPVNWCGSPREMPRAAASYAASSVGRVLAYGPAEGNWLIHDGLGRRVGWVDDEYVRETPDAYLIPQASGDALPAHRILSLPEAEYTVEIANSPSETVECILFADGRVVEASGHLQSAGSPIELSISAGLDQVTLSAVQGFTSFTLVLDSELATASRLVAVTAVSPVGAQGLAFGFDGNLATVSHPGGSMQYSLGVETSDGQPFASAPITLGAGETHTLSWTDWSDGELTSVVLGVDRDSDGSVDGTLVLGNEAAMSTVLPVSPSATSSPESAGGSRGPCLGSLGVVGLAGFVVLTGLAGRSRTSSRR